MCLQCVMTANTLMIQQIIISNMFANSIHLYPGYVTNKQEERHAYNEVLLSFVFFLHVMELSVTTAYKKLASILADNSC